MARVGREVAVFDIRRRWLVVANRIKEYFRMTGDGINVSRFTTVHVCDTFLLARFSNFRSDGVSAPSEQHRRFGAAEQLVVRPMLAPAATAKTVLQEKTFFGYRPGSVFADARERVGPFGVGVLKTELAARSSRGIRGLHPHTHVHDIVVVHAPVDLPRSGIVKEPIPVDVAIGIVRHLGRGAQPEVPILLAKLGRWCRVGRRTETRIEVIVVPHLHF